MKNRFFLRVAKAAGVLALFAIASVTIFLASLWLDHTRTTTLPMPTGPYKVGRTSDTWIDSTRLNPYAPTPGTQQQLAVWIWYPAAPNSSSTVSDYLPANWRHASEQREGFIVRKLLNRDMARVQTHSYINASISSTEPKYPVVILRAGGGALVSDFTTLAEDLASHGYIVVGFDAPYRTGMMVLPDGTVAVRPATQNVEDMPHPAAEQFATQLVASWVADTKFVLDKLQQWNTSDSGRFQGRLNLDEIGIFGHSLGGATAAQFCHDDSRCKAGIDIDGMPFGSVIGEGLHQPFLFLMSDHSREGGSEGDHVRSDMESIYNKIPEDQRWAFTIIGANHFSFSDQMLTKNSILVALTRGIGVLGQMEKYRGLSISRTCTYTFFDVYLKGASVDELKGLPTLYPELKPGIDPAFSRK